MYFTALKLAQSYCQLRCGYSHIVHEHCMNIIMPFSQETYHRIDT